MVTARLLGSPFFCSLDSWLKFIPHLAIQSSWWSQLIGNGPSHPWIMVLPGVTQQWRIQLTTSQSSGCILSIQTSAPVLYSTLKWYMKPTSCLLVITSLKNRSRKPLIYGMKGRLKGSKAWYLGALRCVYGYNWVLSSADRNRAWSRVDGLAAQASRSLSVCDRRWWVCNPWQYGVFHLFLH